ncbi:GNAT family N-acetyltransferase [uncultured Vibrio sp.]|uniref:GNAT family N-acetyltransferase n=1 Tax=uncultured Vibrio sp. TaxID=114054 RepID=UPI0029C7F825|nr:GNAT family N-acetyltransferase [uncultured Vibrio sp.]
MDIVIPGINATIRPMDISDLYDAHELTQRLKWPHTLADWSDIHSLGTSLVMEADDQIIGTACLIPQGNYASVGLIVIADEYQGNGFGKQIMNEIMSQCSDEVSLYLTATEMGKPLYQKLGFDQYAVVEQYQNEIDSSKIELIMPANQASIREYDESDYLRLVELMSKSTGMDRESLANKVTSISDRILMVEEQGKVTGFAALRRFGRGWCIGPVIAESSQNALSLIAHHLVDCHDKFVRLDIVGNPDISTQLVNWGLNKVDTVVQMVKGDTPKLDSSFNQFCLMTQALG